MTRLRAREGAIRMATLVNEPGLRIEHLQVGPYENNVYIVVCPKTKRSAIVDPCTEAGQILEAVKGTQVERILMTHGDRDHWLALEDVKRVHNVPVGIHPDDAEMLPIKPDFALNDGDEIAVGDVRLRVIHTPGHTAGGVCFLTGKHLIAGDTLFPGGTGKTGRRPGDFEQIIGSVRDKLFVLPDDTNVYPGHGKTTTIGTEKPHLQEWIERGW